MTIIDYGSKPLNNCSKSELLDIIQSQLENEVKLIKLIERTTKEVEEEKEVPHYKNYISPEKRSYLEGMERVENIVRNFYGFNNE
ncbi:Phage protein [Enterococcus phage 156]|nr:Phage protein [Enterococcus phage 156]VDB76973.1 Phage protein [Enterococcus phage 156]